MVETIAKKYPIDFIMYIGDDYGNEPIFTYLNNKKSQSSKMLAGVSLSTVTLHVECKRLHMYHGKESDSSEVLLE
jgi:trehalose-6-phosphatase